MSINAVSNAVSAYSTPTNANKKTDTKTQSNSTVKGNDSGVVYEKSKETSSKDKNYGIDREAIIAQMKSEAEQRNSQLRTMVEDMMRQQGKQIGNADSMWRFLAGGNFTVTAAAKAQAKEAISEDGYYGVNQTSDRIVEFAKAITGGDASKAEEMRAAFEKGFKAATKSWGKALPSISQDTYSAVMKKFDDWAGVNKDKETNE